MVRNGGAAMAGFVRGVVRRAVVVVVVGLVAGWLAGGAARAEIAYDLLPSATVGWTDNAAAAPPERHPVSDGFTILGATARAHTLSPHAQHALGYRLSDTFYFQGRGPSALTQELAWLSDLMLDPAWQLRLAAGATYGRTSAPTALDVNSAAPSVLPANANPYVSASGSEEAAYQVNLRTRLVQDLRLSGVHYLRTAQPVIGALGAINYSYVVSGSLRLEREVGQNLFVIEGDVADSVAPGRGAGLSDQVLLAQLLAGWRREIGLEWAGELKVGALGVYDFQSIHVVEPAAIATVTYRRIAWFATLTLSQTAAPNVFIAAATINDQAIARLALPLDTAARYYVMGYGGYNYGRLVDYAGTHRGYEQRLVGASLTARSERIPLWGSLDYTYSSQLGNHPYGTIPDLERQAVLLTVGWAFSTDHDQPPIFHGLMPSIPPLEPGIDGGQQPVLPGTGTPYGTEAPGTVPPGSLPLGVTPAGMPPAGTNLAPPKPFGTSPQSGGLNDFTR
jgi:hypothetical protein